MRVAKDWITASQLCPHPVPQNRDCAALAGGTDSANMVKDLRWGDYLEAVIFGFFSSGFKIITRIFIKGSKKVRVSCRRYDDQSKMLERCAEGPGIQIKVRRQVLFWSFQKECNLDGSLIFKRYLLLNFFFFHFLGCVGLCCGLWASRCSGFSHCGAQTLEHGLSSCGTQA